MADEGITPDGDGGFWVDTGAPRNVRDALAAARRANNPAETVQMLFLAVSYQQQQIEQLELAIGVEHHQAKTAIRQRAQWILDRTPIIGGGS